MPPRIGIVSYCDRLRTQSHFNHEAYARRHGYTYVFDIAPTTRSGFATKLIKIRKFLPLFDWVFWIDDDAFFTQHGVPMDTFVAQAGTSELVMCESPVMNGKWTWVSAGSFLVKNTDRTLQFLDDVLATELDDVEPWWDAEVYGTFTRGDQDAMVYQIETNPAYGDGFLTRLPYEAFNSRPEHFVDSPYDQFLVHFTGGHKGEKAHEFATRWGLTDALLTPKELGAFKQRHLGPVFD